MGQASGPAAGIASFLSPAFAATSDIMKGQGIKSADDFKAAQAERAAQFGMMQAGLADVTYRENLNTTLGNIEAVRSAAKVDPTSPSSVALMDRADQLSNRQRMATVGSLKQQAEDDLASADYLRKAGKFAVDQSYLSAGLDIAGAVAKGISIG